MYDALNLKGDAPKDFSFCFGDHHEAFNDVLQMVKNFKEDLPISAVYSSPKLP